MKATKVKKFGARACATLLTGTILSSGCAIAHAQTAPTPTASTPAAAQTPPAAAAQPAAAPLTPEPAVRVIHSLRVEGSQRIEPDTVLSYVKLREGQAYNNEVLDQAIKDLLASDLFADVTIVGAETGNIVLRVRENPIINRVIFEGNKRLKQDKIDKEIKLKPRQIFTRSAVRQDVARVIELYRRQGRFAATVTPKMVALDQNRVDVIFEVNEGPKSKVREINIIGNQVYSDGKLKEQMATKQAGFRHFLSSNTSYDQDRLAYDQQKLRQFYLTQGYADFKVTSAVAELTPNKRDFIITYVVEEGKRYHFGDVTVDSDIRDFDNKKLAKSLVAKKGDWYNAKKVEDSIDAINQTAGLFGYAFAEVNPDYTPDREKLEMNINFHISEANRTYVERIDINGNTLTQDKVVRREIRLNEGDAFNTFLVKRSQDRINSLGYFQEKFEIAQKPGSAPDRVVLEANVEEKPTGQLNLSLGYSSLERFLVQASIEQRNFRGLGQTLRASVEYSTYSKNIDLGFTEPYLFNRNIAIGGDIFRKDYNSFNYVGDTRQTSYSYVSSGFQIRFGVPLTEYWSLAGRYGLTYDEVGLGQNYFTGGVCDPLKAGRYLCDQIGNRVTSTIGFSLIRDSLNSRLHPTKGQQFSLSEDFAGLGGDVRYLRSKVEYRRFRDLGSGFILGFSGEAAYIQPFNKATSPGADAVRIIDRFYLGEPQFPGFDIRGVGPRVLRYYYQTNSTTGVQSLNTDRNSIADDALGGRAYYLGKLELELPLGSGGRELGLRPSIFVAFGALFGVKRPLPTAVFPTSTDPTTGVTTVLPITTQQYASNGQPYYQVPSTDSTNPSALTTCATGYSATPGGTCTGSSTNTLYTTSTEPFLERFLGDSPKPRVSVGVGINWNSPFGPLRIDIAKALVTVPGDDKKLITFNVGTQF